MSPLSTLGTRLGRRLRRHPIPSQPAGPRTAASGTADRRPAGSRGTGSDTADRHLAASRAAGRRPVLRRRPRPRGDAGVSLIELIVAMGLMGVFMTMFTGAIIQIYGAVNRSESIGESQEQVTRAIARLDKELRYAVEISSPGTSADNRYTYVEYFTTYTGESRCSQLRWDRDSSQLKLRVWELGSTPAGWDGTPVLISYVTATTFPAPRQASSFQQLRLKLEATSGGSDTRTKKDTDVTFTALNSSASRNNTSVTSCTAER